MGVGENIGAGVGGGETVDTRSGDVCGVGVGSGTFVDTGNSLFGWASADATAITLHKERNDCHSTAAFACASSATSGWIGTMFSLATSR